MTDKEEKDPGMKKAKVMTIIEVILCFMAFSSLGVGAVLQKNGVSEEIIMPTVLVVFFGCNIVAIILQITAYPMLMRSDCIRMDAFYEKQEPTELCLPDREALVQRLLENKFKPTEDGGYRRKKLSFLKDTINYHVRITEDTSIADALRREVDHCERARIKPNNLCILLLVYMDEVGECERKEVKEFGRRFIMAEMMAAPKLSVTFLAIAVESGNNIGYFMDIKKRNLSLYSCGCKMVKQLFSLSAE